MAALGCSSDLNVPHWAESAGGGARCSRILRMTIHVELEEVILPPATIELPERLNVARPFTLKASLSS